MNGTIRGAVFFSTMIVLSFSHIYSAVSPHTSRLIMQDSRQSANGESAVTVAIEIRDEQGNPLPGKSAVLQSDNSSFIFARPSPSDLTGFATGFVTCSTPSSGSIWALVDGVKIFPNLISNPSGEIGTDLPNDWDFYQSNPDSQALLWNESGFDTQKSLGMSPPIDGWATEEFSWSQKVRSFELIPGATYTVSAWIRSSTNDQPANAFSGFFLGAAALDDSNLPLTSTKTLIAASTTWHNVTISSIVFPAGASASEISLEEIRMPGTVFFDNVRASLWPPVEFKADHSSPAMITISSPTLLRVEQGTNNGEIKVSWFSVGNDGFAWSNRKGRYEMRVSKDFDTLPVSSWTIVEVPFAPADPGKFETLIIGNLIPGATYQIAIRAKDQNGNAPAFGLSLPTAARSAISPIHSMTVDQIKTTQPLAIQPVFSGETRANSVIDIRIDGNSDGETLSDYSGRWRYKVHASLTEGSHLGVFQSSDLQGNQSAAVEFTFQVGSPSPSDEIKKIYPNPLRLSQGQKARIEFNITGKTHVCIRIFDVNGNELASVVDSDYELGQYKAVWDGKDKNGTALSTNSYYALFETDRERQIVPFSVVR